ncbi:MAG: ISAs1 family transposase [Hyphomicrobiaceae bacterium]|nr:ISAs1 family transposase [Hyphomicrobiaceae bacterium]
MILKFLELLSQIKDRRRAQGKKWQLGPVMLATILAVLSGATSYRKVHGFIRQRLDELNEAFDFGWAKAPAYSTIRSILQGCDADEVERVFRLHGAMLSDRNGDGDDVENMRLLAIDGKVLRASFDDFNDRKAAHLLSIFAADEALVLGHLQIEEKSNEIPAAPQIIKELGLENCLFTMDAMHCQKNF